MRPNTTGERRERRTNRLPFGPVSNRHPKPSPFLAGVSSVITAQAWSISQGNCPGAFPCGRGTPTGAETDRSGSRFIPARAGNTSNGSCDASVRPVHPRAGGEHRVGRGEDVRMTGSSPRGRGTPSASRCRRSTTTVHPRAGGEHSSCAVRIIPSSGSSPRGRGTPADVPHDADVDRFIPARAGNTATHRVLVTAPSVHPRAGGEHPRMAGFRELFPGSSPRGRGTRALFEDCSSLSRFIPARAGNTTSPALPAPPPAVHPRAGGEHLTPSRMSHSPSGSSPRGRGTLFSQPEDSERFLECQRTYQLEAAKNSGRALQFILAISRRDSRPDPRPATAGIARASGHPSPSECADFGRMYRSHSPRRSVPPRR